MLCMCLVNIIVDVCGQVNALVIGTTRAPLGVIGTFGMERWSAGNFPHSQQHTNFQIATSRHLTPACSLPEITRACPGPADLSSTTMAMLLLVLAVAAAIVVVSPAGRERSRPESEPSCIECTALLPRPAPPSPRPASFPPGANISSRCCRLITSIYTAG